MRRKVAQTEVKEQTNKQTERSQGTKGDDRKMLQGRNPQATSWLRTDPIKSI